MKRLALLCGIVAITCTLTYGQKLKPGFNKKEYLEVLRANTRHFDTAQSIMKIPGPTRFEKIYRSKEMGLDNRWDLWVSKDSVAVISLRGTTKRPVGWLENFYAAMVPAKGTVKLGPDFTFEYSLASHPQAAVHVGWLIGMAYLSRDILPRVDSCYRAGIKNFIIHGHSQGGAIAYLMTSHLRALQQQQKIPGDVRFKTYCSAAPKPGNAYYAYTYEAQTAGWAYTIVNSADWVPEMPITIQTVRDVNKTSPFAGAKKMIRKQKFPKDVIFMHAYNQLEKPTRKAQRRYEKYLGRILGKQVVKNLPGYDPPDYYHSTYYVRTGVCIVLLADEAYYEKFPDSETNIFVHHLYEPYIYLAEKLPD